MCIDCIDCFWMIKSLMTLYIQPAGKLYIYIQKIFLKSKTVYTSTVVSNLYNIIQCHVTIEVDGFSVIDKLC